MEQNLKNSVCKQYLSLFFVGALLLSSCDDFLDEAPDNRVKLDDLEKAAQLLTNAYSTSSPAFTDWMSDDFTFTDGTIHRPSHQRLYAWEETKSDPEELDSPEFFWYQTYNAIAHANEVLEVLDDMPVHSDTDKARKRAIESEALLTRAYGHFMLVNLFGKQYDSQTSSGDPGVPYVKHPETSFIAEYKRISVKRVYDEIEDDLLDGIDLLDDSFFNNSGKYHFNRNAALAFASRFYLFKRDMTRCKFYCDELLQANPHAFVRNFISDEFRNAKSSITGYPQLYSSPDQTSNLLLMRKISLVQRNDFAYGVEENFYGSLFATHPFRDATDERENPAFVKGRNTLFPVRYESLFERTSINSNVGDPYHIGIMFRGEEVLLNRVEANTFLGNYDAAIADLQVLTNRRYTGGDVTLSLELLRSFMGADDDPEFSDLLVLLNYLLIERRKEFIGQGIRWFDIKRFGFGVQHALGNGVNTIELSADDPRKVLQIPISAQEIGGLEPNDR